jgi:hypothetical protein
MGRPIDLTVSKLEQTDDDRVYMKVGKFDIRIVHTDEGVVVDIFPWDSDGSYTGDCLATTFAFDSDADEAIFPD